MTEKETAIRLQKKWRQIFIAFCVGQNIYMVWYLALDTF